MVNSDTPPLAININIKPGFLHQESLTIKPTATATAKTMISFRDAAILALLSCIPLSFGFQNLLQRTTSCRTRDSFELTVRHPHHTLLSYEHAASASRVILSANGDVVQEPTDEWYPHDPASTTPQLLAGIWHQIAQAGRMAHGETATVVYPEMEETLQSPKYLNLLMAHLDYCKDVCDHFGITTVLRPYEKDGKVQGFTTKSLRKAKKGCDNDDDDDEEYIFDYDPFWDDGTDFDNLYKGVDDEDVVEDPYPQIEVLVPDDDDEIISTSKRWVQKVMCDMGICPFTATAESAGLPMGPVYYHVDRSSSVEDVYTAYWEEVVRVEQQPERDLSTTLLILPEFMMNNVELFESFSNSLTQPLTALQVEDLLQLVFFHPHWSFRDGGDRSNADAGAAGAAANYARRSPWPMINILRTKQVRTAQRGIPTGLVYKQNEKTLANVGVHELETMLRLRDWSAVADVKVNRKEYDALRIAQGFQQSGQISAEDASLTHDATPSANKLDRQAAEQGDLVRVLKQALEKRLGKENDAGVAPLSGPETSATAMATDVLIEELDRLAFGAEDAPVAGKSEMANEPSPSESESTVPAEYEAARQAKLEEARRMLMADLQGPQETNDSPRGDEMADVIFGRGGISSHSDSDDDAAAFSKFSS